MRTVLFISALFVLSACGSKFKKIPLDKLDPELRKRGDLIVNDYFTLCKTQHGFVKEFKEKKYITPLVHSAIVSPRGIYSRTPEMFSLVFGEVYSRQLFQVVDKGVVKTMRYKVECELLKGEFVEFKIDLNKQSNLARMYVYVPWKKNGKDSRLNLYGTNVDALMGLK